MDRKTNNILLVLGLIALVIWWGQREVSPGDVTDSSDPSELNNGISELSTQSQQTFSGGHSKVVVDRTPILQHR